MNTKCIIMYRVEFTLSVDEGFLCLGKAGQAFKKGLVDLFSE